jgi:AbrB family looped-hinge helix DNA binding protein
MNFTVEKTLDKLARIVIPKHMRDYYEINFGDKLQLIATSDGILVTKSKKTSEQENEQK